jgi:hypothetical protein
MYIFANGSKLLISSDRGCLLGSGTLINANGRYFDVTYSGERSVRDGVVTKPQGSWIAQETFSLANKPIKCVETVEPLAVTYYCQYGASFPCSTVTLEERGNDGHARPAEYDAKMPAKVRGEIVWARPRYADTPLWNEEQVRGSIVAVFRGPPPPASPVPISEQIHRAQAAGAAAVILVECDSHPKEVGGGAGVHTKGGPVYTLPGSAAAGSVFSMIPACKVSIKCTPLLHEGKEIEIYFGISAGTVVIPIQNRQDKLPKSEASTMLANLKTTRRSELSVDMEQASGSLSQRPREKSQSKHQMPPSSDSSTVAPSQEFWEQVMKEGIVDERFKRELESGLGIRVRDLHASFTAMKHDLISVAGFAKAEALVSSNETPL